MSLTPWRIGTEKIAYPTFRPYTPLLAPSPTSTLYLHFSQQNPDRVYIAILQVFQGKQLHAWFVYDNYFYFFLHAIDLTMATWPTFGQGDLRSSLKRASVRVLLASYTEIQKEMIHFTLLDTLWLKLLQPSCSHERNQPENKADTSAISVWSSKRIWASSAVTEPLVILLGASHALDFLHGTVNFLIVHINLSWGSLLFVHKKMIQRWILNRPHPTKNYYLGIKK